MNEINRLQLHLTEMKQIYNSRIISDPMHPCKQFRKAAFTQLFIDLRDSMYIIKKTGYVFNEYQDIIHMEKSDGYDCKVENIYDAITFIRNASCHPESFKNNINKNITFSFNTVSGKGTIGIVNDVNIESQYDDDIAIFYGPQRIYYKRHIGKILKEIEDFMISYNKK